MHFQPFSSQEQIVVRNLLFSELACPPPSAFDPETPAIQNALEFLDTTYLSTRQRIDQARSRCASIMHDCQGATDKLSINRRNAITRILQDLDTLHRRMEKACDDVWNDIRGGSLKHPRTQILDRFDQLDSESAALYARADRLGNS